MFEHLNMHVPKRIEEDLERVSAVLIPLIKKEDGYHILFEVRSHKLNHQPGEVCFPGGRLEEGETSLEAAIRETKEELQIDSSNLKLYGPLDYFISPSKIRIEPFLGELIHYHGQFSSDEVDSVFTVPLRFFQKTQPALYYTDILTVPENNFPFEDIPGGKHYPWAKGKYQVAFYHYENHIIWGLTAKLLLNNIQYIRD
ncbi:MULTISPECIES: NUDIX hydrolase [Anaerostipes]|uniref:NUDIX hydrolase n=1 Tax=Anaerostipes TaxID=207244 RepID=UPI000951ABA2|nr:MULTISPECIES: CoA pyrophosphatase [unclassified Anaerostipes]MCI5623831.1 CoA pyrophosphatase [Anaerostipes sp.]MDY2726703.1 CoA pyrophosphatase [Anaerostipes faecalis]OLR59696.1 coenzyme A pyrophosphatase [Anaerostipes sp. 494a]